MTIKNNLKKYLLALFLGSTMPLAFAPFHYWWVSIIAITGLIYLWQTSTLKKQSFLTGLYFGLGYFGMGIHWVFYSLHDFGSATPFVAGLITVLLIVWQALYIGLLGFVYQYVKNNFSESVAYLLLPLLWFGMEWLKGIVLTGFPWLSVGYSFIDAPFASFAPWIGSYGLGAAGISLSLVLWLFVSKTWRTNRIVIVILGSIFVVLSVLANKQQTTAMDQSLTVTQIQGNIAQEIKWQADKRQEIFNVYWQQTANYWDSDLIVWPETAVPGRSELIEESVLLPMSMIAAENETNILFGVVISDLAKSRYFNSMLMVGEHQGLYHKRHLVPFGEFMPFRSILNFVNEFIRIPMSDMQAGDSQQQLMSVNGIKLGVSICYEDVFSRDINQDLPDANILINTSNDAWFGDSLAPHQHLQIAQMRALETGRPMVRSTNTGITAFIDHKGKIIQKTRQFEVAAITRKVTGRTGQTFFVRIQPYQGFIVLMLAFILLSKQLIRIVK